MFGKMMSIPDELMWSYYELVTDRTPDQIAALKAEVSSGKMHPMDAKMQLAQEVIAPFHGAEAARKAADNFQRVFRDRQAPEEAPSRNCPVEASSTKTDSTARRVAIIAVEKRSGASDQARRRRNRRRTRERSSRKVHS